MEDSKPLRTTVRPKASADALELARLVVSLFADSKRLAAEAARDVVLIGGIWEPDLDEAWQLVREAYAGELVWGAKRINYLDGPRPEEPILRVEVETPSEFSGAVMGDLAARRATIFGMQGVPSGHVIVAEVPLATLRGYPATLHALTRGAARAGAEFHSYETAPRDPGPPDEAMAAALRA